MKSFNLLNSKLRTYGWRGLCWMEIESMFYGLIKNIPGMLGFILRYFWCKLTFKMLKGFCWLQPNVSLVNSQNVSSGKNLAINSGSYINGAGGIEFGDNVIVSPNVVISSGEHQFKDRLTPIIIQEIKKRKVTIGSDVWIGANVVVLPGMELAVGTVVGAGAVVTKSTKSYWVVAGVPAKKIGERNE